MTRLRKKCLSVEQSSIYVDPDGSSFIERWLGDAHSHRRSGDLDARVFPRWQRIQD